jgi:hypothetical protein
MVRRTTLISLPQSRKTAAMIALTALPRTLGDPAPPFSLYLMCLLIPVFSAMDARCLLLVTLLLNSFV